MLLISIFCSGIFKSTIKNYFLIFVKIKKVKPNIKNKVRARVWERGAGQTAACGSGACAVLVAAASRGLTNRKADIVLDGGTLIIEWKDNNRVSMTGPTEISFNGHFSL